VVKGVPANRANLCHHCSVPTQPAHIRPITKDDIDVFTHVAYVAFGEHMLPQELELHRQTLEWDRAFAAYDGDRIVGTAAVFAMQLTVPGSQLVPAGGISWVGVLPTHRRRGLLRDLMTAALDAIEIRREPVSILLASESRIYGRFGFGAATRGVGFQIDRAHAAFLQTPHAAGHVRLVPKDTAAVLLPLVYEEFRVAQAGAIDRPAWWWKTYFADVEREQGGAGERFYAIHDGPSGTPDGYVAYRIKESAKKGWAATGLPDSTLIVEECVSRDPEVQGLLWHFCLNTDLVSTITASHVPVDDPLWWRLADPRRMMVTRLIDGLWVRLLDVSAALAARRYGVADSIAIRVLDRLRPGIEGTYQLDGAPDSATCRRANLPADLLMDVAQLGAAYLGGASFRSMARAGLVKEATPGAIARADLMFRAEPAPWSLTDF
jgi:predicted acetyltransferase